MFQCFQISFCPSLNFIKMTLPALEPAVYRDYHGLIMTERWTLPPADLAETAGCDGVESNGSTVSVTSAGRGLESSQHRARMSGQFIAGCMAPHNKCWSSCWMRVNSSFSSAPDVRGNISSGGARPGKLACRVSLYWQEGRHRPAPHPLSPRHSVAPI